MFKKLGIIIGLLTTINAFSQTIQVINAISGLGVGFVNVNYLNQNQTAKNVIADENGFFELDMTNLDAITISCVGYENKTVVPSFINKTITIKPVTYQLSEVVISPRDSLRTIGYLNNRVSSQTISLINMGLQVLFIEKPLEDVVIQSFLFRVKRVKKNTTYRLHLYKNKSNNNKDEPGEELLRDNKIYQLSRNDIGLISVDLSEYNIVIPKEGIYIGIEGYSKESQNQTIEKEELRKKNMFYLETVLCKDSVYWHFNGYSAFNRWVDFNALRLEHFKKLSSENELSNYFIPALGLSVKRLN
jgi:hypothetical protein